MADIICKKCGKEIDSESRLCQFCGEVILQDDEKEDEIKETDAESNSEKKEIKKRKKKRIIILASIIVGIMLVIASIIIYKKVIKPANKYNAAEMLMDDGKYQDAINLFSELGSYKDVDKRIAECEILLGKEYYEKKDYKSAVELFIKHYDDSEAKKYVYKCFIDIAGLDYYNAYLDAVIEFDAFIRKELNSMIDFVKDAKLGLNKTEKWISNYDDHREDLMNEKEKLQNKREWFGRVFNPTIIKTCNDQILSDAYDAFIDFNQEMTELISHTHNYIDDFREANYENINSDTKSVTDKFNKYIETISKIYKGAGEDYVVMEELDLSGFYDFKKEEDEFVEELFGSEENRDKWAKEKDSGKASDDTSSESNDNKNKEESYYENDTFEVSYKTLYNNILGHSTIIHKVYASKTKDVEATVIAYDLNGNVIGKATDEIELVEGQYNFFRFLFTADVSNATFEVKVNIKEPDGLRGPEDAVELVTYSDDGFNIFLTFKQVKPSVGEFAKFKILYIKDGQVVGDGDGYYSVYAKNLNGQDTTDVAKLLLDVDEYDHIEYFFEP